MNKPSGKRKRVVEKQTCEVTSKEEEQQVNQIPAEVTLERGEKDKMVILGEGVDSTELTKKLRNRLKYANLVGLGPLEEKEENKK